jgi:signal transduction histidine kinase
MSSTEQTINVDVQPGVQLQGWPNVLERALDNLLRNAVRFNPPGQSIELSARNEDDTLFISVRDHGPGVSAEHLAQLGEPFYRAPNQTAPGYGLGLAIAKRAAEKHGGSLMLENHPQGGFIASIVVPRDTNFSPTV